MFCFPACLHKMMLLLLLTRGGYESGEMKPLASRMKQVTSAANVRVVLFVWLLVLSELDLLMFLHVVCRLVSSFVSLFVYNASFFLFLFMKRKKRFLVLLL